VARDDLAAERSGSTIALIGITTAAGIGLGYPLVGLLAQYKGLHAPFWLVAALSAFALVAAIAVLPESPARPARIDRPGTILLGLGIAGLIVVLAEGQSWGWLSAATLAGVIGSTVLLGAWAGWELRSRHPLIELRLLRRPSVLAANVTAFLIAVGFYPLMSLVVRFVQAPAESGYGFAAPVVIAGLMLTPFSLTSFAASKIALWVARRSSAELVVAASCMVLIASLVLFLLARSTYWEIVLAMSLNGFGVGCAYAVNPQQITGRVPATETGSAISFYQLVRTIAYALGSALSATLLLFYVPAGEETPTNAGFSTAALVCIAVLLSALAASALFVVFREKPDPASTGQRHPGD
jgi:predicted MFS family arabinose efflux permease